MNQPRSVGIDLVRIFAVLAVIAGHIPRHPQWVTLSTYSWHVPVFFFFSGYLWNSTRSPSQEISRRSKSLVIPYLSWAIILFVPLIVHLSLTGGNWRVEILRTATLNDANRLFTTFWFVAALFFSAVLVKYSEAGPRWFIWCACAGSVIYSIIGASTLSQLPLRIGLALPGALFILLGQEFRKARQRLTSLPEVPLALICITMAGALIALGLSKPLDMKYADMGTPMLSVLIAALIAGGLIILAEHIGPALPRAFAKVVTPLAQSALVVVLVHPALLWWMERFPHITGFRLYTIVVAVSWSLALLIHLSAASPILAGVPLWTRSSSGDNGKPKSSTTKNGGTNL